MKRYRDRDTNLIHEIGEEIEVTKKRYEEINSTSFGVFLEEVKKKTTNKK